VLDQFGFVHKKPLGKSVDEGECLGYLVFTRQTTKQPARLVVCGRGNDWHTQQGLLHQIKAIDFQGVNTTRCFATALG
jgi:hypothetical protein